MAIKMDTETQNEIPAAVRDYLEMGRGQINDTIKRLVESINENEKSNVEAWEKRFKEFDEKITSSMTEHSNTLDKLRGAIENRLEELEKATPGRVEIEPQRMVIQIIKDAGLSEEITINAQHHRFQDLLLDLKAGHNVYNYGPTGSGKTVAVYTAAKVLGLNVYRKVLNRETSPYVFSGYMKGSEYVEGMAFRPYTQGGILFADELDNGNANAGTTLKEYADADEVWFPHGLFKKHKDFRLVANANTIGNGANSQYVGRNQQDKALLNIFKFHYWGYDESFEETICWAEFLACGGKAEQKPTFDKFLKGMRQFRQAIVELNINHILSPRNFKQASKDFALGRDIQHITDTIILKGLDEGQTTKIIEKVKGYNPMKVKAEKVASVWQ